jgi:hypothetical protein
VWQKSAKFPCPELAPVTITTFHSRLFIQSLHFVSLAPFPSEGTFLLGLIDASFELTLVSAWAASSATRSLRQPSNRRSIWVAGTLPRSATCSCPINCKHAVGEAIEIGALSAYERPLPTMIEYDWLFSGAVQAVQA